MRIERVILEHHGDVAVARAHVVDDPRADLDRAFAGLLEAGDGAQERALAAAAGPTSTANSPSATIRSIPFHRRDGAVAFVETVILTGARNSP